EPVLLPLCDLPLAWQHWQEARTQLWEGNLEANFTAPPHATLKFAVRVRSRQVAGVSCNEQALAAELWRFYDMPALLAAIERRLELDRQPGGGRVFCIAAFDPQDGHLLRYVRSLSRTEEKVQITVSDFTAVPPAAQ